MIGPVNVSFGHTCTVAPPQQQSSWAERLAYARLVLHYRTGKCLSNAELGRAADRTGEWVTKWADSPVPPRDYTVHAPLARRLDVTERWLIHDEGEPPMRELWAAWLRQRRGDPPLRYVAERPSAPPLPAGALKPVTKARSDEKKGRTR